MGHIFKQTGSSLLQKYFGSGVAKINGLYHKQNMYIMHFAVSIFPLYVGFILQNLNFKIMEQYIYLSKVYIVQRLYLLYSFIQMYMCYSVCFINFCILSSMSHDDQKILF